MSLLNKYKEALDKKGATLPENIKVQFIYIKDNFENSDKILNNKSLMKDVKDYYMVVYKMYRSQDINLLYLSNETLYDIILRTSSTNELMNLCKTSKHLYNLCKTERVAKHIIENLIKLNKPNEFLSYADLLKDYIQFANNISNKIKSYIKITNRIEKYITWIYEITKNTEKIDINEYYGNCIIITDNGMYFLYDEEAGANEDLSKFKSIFEFEGEGISRDHIALNIFYECLPYIKTCKKLRMSVREDGYYNILSKVLPDTNIYDLELVNLTGFNKEGLKNIKNLRLFEIRPDYERYSVTDHRMKEFNEIDLLNNSIRTFEVHIDYRSVIPEINSKFPNINVEMFSDNSPNVFY